MISLTILLNILGFYLLYTTSDKMDSQTLLGFEAKLVQHKRTAKIIGIALLLLSCVGCVMAFGLASGIFSFIIYVMTFGSLIVLLAPLKLVNMKTLALFMVLSVVVEFLVYIP